MKTLCWNCRGIGNSATVRELRDLAKEFAPPVLCILETQIAKTRVENLRYVLGYDNSFAVNSNGRSGGLGVFWNNDVSLKVTKYSQYHIDTEIHENGKEPWRLTFVYGEANRAERHKTWALLKFIKSDSPLPWICMGDFNEILRPEEQFGPNPREEYLIEGFREAVDVCGFCDIGYVGLDWTWEKKVANGVYVRVRLDRALATADGCSMFPMASLKHLTAVKSDHCPILLSTEREDCCAHGAYRGRPFRYEVMWETNKDLFPLISQVWKDDMHNGNLMELNRKLSRLTSMLQQWSATSFGAVRRQLRTIRRKLEILRAHPQRMGPSAEEKEIEDKIVMLSLQEEIMWRQRSRIQWLCEGDNNTKFFHHKASRRHNKNKISKLTRADGTICEDIDEMKQMTSEYYANLYSSEGTTNMEQVLSHIPKRVTDSMNDYLCRPFTHQEVKEALFQMSPLKAPGPDGYPAHFFQRNWDICGEDVTRAVLGVLNGDESPEEINNDSLLFFKANTCAAKETEMILTTYCAASGQRINYDKSSIFFSKKCSDSIKEEVKEKVNVFNEALTERYLGLPTDVGRSKAGVFKYLKDRVWSKVQGWMEKSLSVGGKEVLIKAVAQAIPTYSMSCFRLPRGLCHAINEMIRKFWWGSKDGKRKTCWVSWEKMTQPKYLGGLGFRDIEMFNLALLARQAWRIMQNSHSLSTKLLRALYFPNGEFLEAVLGSKPSQIWRSILDGRDVLKLGLIKRIGNGENTSIWDHNWLPRDEGEVLKARSMTKESSCKLCGVEVDSWLHALFQCTMARCVWALVDKDLTEHIVAVQINNPKLWLFHMQETLPAKMFQKLLVICWAIWGARRKALYEEVFQSPLSTFSFISKYIDDMELAGFCEQSTTRLVKTKDPPLKWLPPPEGFLKFNVDGAVARTGDKGAVGVICRDNAGNYIAASAIVINGLVDPPSLEAMACNEAISLALDVDACKCVIASDCLEVIVNLHKESLCAYSSILRDIKSRSRLLQDVIFKHEGRCCNNEAHAIAKSVCKMMPGRYIWLLERPNILHVPQNIMTTDK